MNLGQQASRLAAHGFLQRWALKSFSDPAAILGSASTRLPAQPFRARTARGFSAVHLSRQVAAAAAGGLLSMVERPGAD